jgi:hypothetical protein
MRIVSSLGPMVALAVGVAFAAPISALADDSAHPFHKHAVQTHRMAHAGLTSNAIALAPVLAPAPAAPAKNSDGLSRDSADCNTGCIDH